MIEDIEKFGVLWTMRDAKTNTLYTIKNENLYNSCKRWFMLVQDKNNKTLYLAFHNTSTTKEQIITHIKTSKYSKKQKLYEINNISLNKNPDIPKHSRNDYDTIFNDKNLYAIPEQYISIIENIDPKMPKYVEEEKILKQQDHFLLSITADNVESSDKEFTMDNLSLGDNFKPVDVYFQTINGKNFSRNLTKNERKISNKTMPRIAFQIFEKQISNLPLKEKENFPICRYSLNGGIICGIYSSIKEFQNHRKSLEYMQYKCDNNKEFVIYCWNIFSTIIFVQECLKRFGNQGEKFVLSYTKKDKNEIELENSKLLKQRDYIMKKTVKNLILYGPPGTGKTFSVGEYITDIVRQNPGLKADNEEQRINDVVRDLSWYSAIGLSMYQNGKHKKYKVADLMEQKIIKVFSLTRENKNIRAALWAQMQMHTPSDCQTVNYTNRQAPFIFEKNNNSEWSLTEDGIRFIEENLADQLEFLNAKNSQRKIEDFYKFITFHQSYSYEEFIEGIKPKINNDDDNSTISYEYNRGIFKEICQQANSDPSNNYLLIIDEINRGNISKIFGELITLIEPDKRVVPNGERIFENTKTKNEELVVTLPYTKSKFGVPSNLYILGTMNTSDRSIASIDIALRRRFKFVEMMPQKELVADFGIRFADIFEKLNTKIKILLDRDHQIGHSYFIKTKYENAGIDELKTIWFSDILPLLNEYFYCDWEKLKLIVPGFIKKLEVPEVLKNECDDSIYEFKTLEEIEDFEKALNQEKFE